MTPAGANKEKLDALPVTRIHGVGEARAALLAHLDIHTVEDVLWTPPARYEDRRRFTPIADAPEGEPVCLAGEVQAAGWVRARFGKSFFSAILRDDSGLLECRWFNAPYLRDQIHPGRRMVLFGRVRPYKKTRVCDHPEFEIDDGEEAGDALHMGRIVPIYRLTEKLSQRVARRLAWNAVTAFAEMAEDALPSATRERLHLSGLAAALRQVHFPDSLEEAERARHRLVAEEFLCQQLVLVARKIASERFLEGLVHAPPGLWRNRFLAALPFRFTAAQERVRAEIAADMARPRPMHRLLQGDVGSGKTVVAVCAVLDALESGSQCAIMAPTEILAAQHAQVFARYLAPFDIRGALLTGDTSSAERARTLAGLADGSLPVVVGTHALIGERVRFRRLGLAVIDEQHKFGVAQRGLLYGKGLHPDVLVMTATPIPRTLGMTLYGDLDVSTIDEMPPGRQAIKTRRVKTKDLPEAYSFIRQQVAEGRQAFIVYPIISESEALEVKAAETMYHEFCVTAFRQERLGLLHGRMTAAEKEDVMRRFKAGDIQILVSTSVVEVGIDLPNATVMLVENAERFGLAQLHQLRGRIGRGAHQAYCLLQGHPSTLEAWKRLRIMEQTQDGFRIAEEDFKIRGMGNLLGREQSGLPVLRLADPLRDGPILADARAEAFLLLDADPRLRAPENAAIREKARAMYRRAGALARVG